METSSEAGIIADTSGLVSLFSPDDRNHAESVKAAATRKRGILILTAVFVEFVNVMGRKAGHSVELAAIPELTPPLFILNEPSHLPNMPAFKKFETLPNAVSFTDCIVMAVADDYGTKDIFGFDKQFVDAGYHRIEPATEWK